jgi:hypothetical protein
MSERERFLLFLDRLPVLDLTWNAETQTAWWRCYHILWRWACRLIVNDAIEEFVRSSSRPARPESPSRYRGIFVVRNTTGKYWRGPCERRTSAMARLSVRMLQHQKVRNE